MPKETHFKIVITVYNASNWIVRCLSSVQVQKYDNWQAIVHIDPCTDDTYEQAEQYINELKDARFTLIKNSVRRFRPINDFEGICLSKAAKEDVIVSLDGDDWLHGEFVLSYLNIVYCDPNMWITWGSYMCSHNGSIGRAACALPAPYDDPYNDIRWWRYSHLKTFRYFLYCGIKDEDLRDSETGNYYSVALDMALMFPMIEMAGESHRKFINKVLYVYNTENPISNEKVRNLRCLKFNHEIRYGRIPYDAMTREELYQCQPNRDY